MKVLLDNNLSPEIARGVNHLLSPQGHLIIAKKDKFGDTRIADVDWIREKLVRMPSGKRLAARLLTVCSCAPLGEESETVGLLDEILHRAEFEIETE